MKKDCFRKFFPLIGLILLFYILYTVNIDKIIDIFLSIDPVYYIFLIAAPFPPILLENLEWQFILKEQKINISYLNSLKMIFVWIFFGTIAPFGAGQIAGILYLKKMSGESLSKCILNILIISIIDILSLLSLAIFGMFLLGFQISLMVFWSTVIIIFAISSLVLAFKSSLGKRLIIRLFRKYALLKSKQEIDISINDIDKDIPSLKDLVLPFTISIFGWILYYTEIYLISMLFFRGVPYLHFVLIYPVATIVGILPITYRGLGTTEAALITLFSTFGVSPASIVSLSLLWFVLTFIPGFLGVILYSLEGTQKEIDY